MSTHPAETTGSEETTERTESTERSEHAEPTETTDVVVIGAGPVGEVAAQYVTQNSGLSVTIVERELLGGECSYYACIPSKALLTPIALARTSGDLTGVTPAELDREALLRRRDEWVGGYDDSSQHDWAEGMGLEVIRGAAELVAERRVRVGGRVIEARRAVVVATGSEPVVPEGLRPALPWISRDATGVREIPQRLIIVGGGVVACEAATWMAALGSSVTLLVRGERLLGSQEPLASDAVLGGLRALGVSVEFGAEVHSADRPGAVETGLGRVRGGEVTVHSSGGTHTADELLVATGRRPRTAGLGLERIGVDPRDLPRAGSRPLPWLHVIGDAGGEAPLTHWGKYRARCVGEEIAGLPVRQVDPPVPQVIFTEPSVASVGMTEEAARDAGYEVVVSEVGPDAAGVALLRDTPEEAARIVVNGATGRLLGATFIGQGLSEVMHSATVAITAGIPVSVLRHAVASFPTASEVWLNLLEQLPDSLLR